MQRYSAVRALVVVAMLTALSGCDAGMWSAELDGYRPGPQPDQVTVTYIVGYDDPAGHAEVIDESAKSVTVKVLYDGSDEMKPSIAIHKEAVAILQALLGERLVLDEHGNQVPISKRPIG